MVRRRSQFRYSRWDGTQVGFDLDADSVLEELNDDLLYHGDLNAALRRLMHQGFEDRNGERIQGMKDLMDKLRQQRRERLESYDLGGVYDDIAQQLRAVVDMERKHPRLVIAGTEDEGGRGLRLVAGISQRWGVDTLRSGKRVWADVAVAS